MAVMAHLQNRNQFNSKKRYHFLDNYSQYHSRTGPKCLHWSSMSIRNDILTESERFSRRDWLHEGLQNREVWEPFRSWDQSFFEKINDIKLGSKLDWSTWPESALKVGCCLLRSNKFTSKTCIEIYRYYIIDGSVWLNLFKWFIYHTYY